MNSKWLVRAASTHLYKSNNKPTFFWKLDITIQRFAVRHILVERNLYLLYLGCVTGLEMSWMTWNNIECNRILETLISPESPGVHYVRQRYHQPILLKCPKLVCLDAQLIDGAYVDFLNCSKALSKALGDERDIWCIWSLTLLGIPAF